LTIKREEVEACEVYSHKHLFLLLLRGGGRGGGGRCQVYSHKHLLLLLLRGEEQVEEGGVRSSHTNRSACMCLRP
jgi:hypothetical protein